MRSALAEELLSRRMAGTVATSTAGQGAAEWQRLGQLTRPPGVRGNDFADRPAGLGAPSLAGQELAPPPITSRPYEGYSGAGGMGMARQDTFGYIAGSDLASQRALDMTRIQSTVDPLANHFVSTFDNMDAQRARTGMRDRAAAVMGQGHPMAAYNPDPAANAPYNPHTGRGVNASYDPFSAEHANQVLSQMARRPGMTNNQIAASQARIDYQNQAPEMHQRAMELLKAQQPGQFTPELKTLYDAQGNPAGQAMTTSRNSAVPYNGGNTGQGTGVQTGQTGQAAPTAAELEAQQIDAQIAAEEAKLAAGDTRGGALGGAFGTGYNRSQRLAELKQRRAKLGEMSGPKTADPLGLF